jgi:hypothetical protein
MSSWERPSGSESFLTFSFLIRTFVIACIPPFFSGSIHHIKYYLYACPLHILILQTFHCPYIITAPFSYCYYSSGHDRLSWVLIGTRPSRIMALACALPAAPLGSPSPDGSVQAHIHSPPVRRFDRICLVGRSCSWSLGSLD